MRTLFTTLVLSIGCGNMTSQQLLAIGSACTKDSPTRSVCGTLDRYFCDTAHPNGYCKASCHNDAECPTGSVCAGAGMVSPGECHKSCTQASMNTDCRVQEGYVCKKKPDDASHDYCDQD